MVHEVRDVVRVVRPLGIVVIEAIQAYDGPRGEVGAGCNVARVGLRAGGPQPVGGEGHGHLLPAAVVADLRAG